MNGISGTSKAEGGAQAPFNDVWNRIQAQYGEKPKEMKSAKKELDKDDFLKIMLTQMQHQDPTKPFDADKMMAELAQITSVEQMKNMNRTLDKMATREQPMERLAMTSMIGRTVAIDQRRFPHAKGDNTSLAFRLPEGAIEVKISVIDEAGKTVFEKDIGAKEAGDISYLWNGKKTNSLHAESGNYTLSVDAKSESGRNIDTGGSMNGRIVGVSFQGAEPVFLVGDPANPSKVTMGNIVRIEEDQAPGGGAVAARAASGPKPKQVFTFTKGEGSKALQPGQMTPELAEAFQKQQERIADGEGAESAPEGAAAVEAPAQAAPAVRAEGFPNGLTELNDEPIESAKGGGADG